MRIQRMLLAGIAICGLISVAAISVALAQELVPVTTIGDTNIDFGNALSNIFAAALPILGSIITALGTWVLVTINRKTGLQIETSRAETLSRWATNRAGEFLSKFDSIKGMKIDVGNVLIADLADTALVAIPDAVKYFGLDGERLQKMIIQKIGILTASSTVAPEVTVVAATGTGGATGPAGEPNRLGKERI